MLLGFESLTGSTIENRPCGGFRVLPGERAGGTFGKGSKPLPDILRLKRIKISTTDTARVTREIPCRATLHVGNDTIQYMPDRKPSFEEAIQRHFDAITNRDIEAFKAHMTRNEVMYTIVQNGHAFTTPEEIIAVHEEWFKDPNWVWEGTLVHKVVGEDMGMALVKYDYRPKSEDQSVSTWLTYVLRIEEGEWRIVHDQNTCLDFPAFARAAGLAI
jgi:ketosteroid isomerase-like protein